MSCLIESILLQIPIPTFYFDASEAPNDKKWLVIDGYQRLTTLKLFAVDKTLVLKGLALLTDLNGKDYPSLNINLQRRIQRTQFLTYIVKPNTPALIRDNIIKRIQLR